VEYETSKCDCYDFQVFMKCFVAVRGERFTGFGTERPATIFVDEVARLAYLDWLAFTVQTTATDPVRIATGEARRQHPRHGAER
jgi:hypothetical protein